MPCIIDICQPLKCFYLTGTGNNQWIKTLTMDGIAAWKTWWCKNIFEQKTMPASIVGTALVVSSETWWYGVVFVYLIFLSIF